MSTTICIFGDSIVWGEGDSHRGGWAARLKDYFLENDFDISIYNLGVDADNSTDLIERIEAEAEYREAEIIIIAIGINDTAYTQAGKRHLTPLKKFKKNIYQLQEIASNVAEKVIFVGLTEVDEAKTQPYPKSQSKKNYSNGHITQYDNALMTICKETNVLYIKLKGLIQKKDLKDGLHPNEKGHKKIFSAVRKALLEFKIDN